VTDEQGNVVSEVQYNAFSETDEAEKGKIGGEWVEMPEGWKPGDPPTSPI
jgi:hypothetical protein